MGELLGPTIGLVAGISLILFRKGIASFLEKAFSKFPKHHDGIKTFNIRFEVRPFFVAIMGLVIIIFSLMGLSSIL